MSSKIKKYKNDPLFRELQRSINERGNKMALKNVIINAVDNGFITTIRTETVGYPSEEKHYVDLSFEDVLKRIEQFSTARATKQSSLKLANEFSQDS